MVLGLGFPDELRGELTLKNPHVDCRIFDAAELQQYAFNTSSLTVTFISLRKLKVRALIFSASSLSCPRKICDKCNEKTPFTLVQELSAVMC